MEIKNICVFCGAQKGDDPMYVLEAKKLGYLIAEEKINLIYGAGTTGLMGAVAKAVMEKKGKVFGYTTDEIVDLEKPYDEQKGDLLNVRVLSTLQARKWHMIQRSDAFIVLPGGFGTLDEISEIITLQQIGQIDKPMAIVNLKGYFNPLEKLIDGLFEKKFARKNLDYKYKFVDSVKNAIEHLKNL